MKYGPIFAGFAFWSLVVAGLSLIILAGRAYAFDNGQYENVDPATRSWFKSIKNAQGVPCCDIGDGHKTAFKTDDKGNYFVPNPFEDNGWVKVPPEKVILNQGNPNEEAVVWYVPQFEDGNAKSIYVRCFVPAAVY